MVIQGQHCVVNAQGLVRTDAPTVHRTAVAYSFNWSHRWDGVGVSEVVDVSCAFLRGKPREVEEPWFFEPPARGLPGIVEVVRVFLDYPILPRNGGKNCVTPSKKTPGHLSNWTLPSSACVTVLDISSE